MKLRQPARKQPTLRGSCRRPRSIGGGSWRKLSPMPQCKLFGETPAGLLDPIDLQHPALGANLDPSPWPVPTLLQDAATYQGGPTMFACHRRDEGVEPS